MCGKISVPDSPEFRTRCIQQMPKPDFADEVWGKPGTPKKPSEVSKPRETSKPTEIAKPMDEDAAALDKILHELYSPKNH